MDASLEPIGRDEWDDARARHLLNRAGFGVPHERVERLARLHPFEAVSWFVDYEGEEAAGERPEWLEATAEMREEQAAFRQSARMMMNRGVVAGDEQEGLREEIRKKQRELRRAQRESIERLKGWWLRRMIETPRPLEEKMTLFWHGHFATSAEKVRSPQANYDLNRLFRSAATGNFKLLTYEVGCSPAMMLYLDNARSRKEHPNENWARELMELYTLGQGRYTEDDIKAAARAFTGWSTDGETFIYRPGIHDEGEKSFMGRRGNFNGQDIIDIIFARPDAAEFIASKLWEFFVHERPAPALRRELGMTLYRSGYELRPLLRKMFLSRAFYSEEAMGSRIKSPAELVISMVEALDLETDWDPLTEDYLLFAMGRMGQDLFYAPSVKGWPGGRTWISAGTLLSRYNTSNFLTQGLLTDLSPRLRREVIRRYRGNREFRRSLRAARQRARAAGGEGMMEATGMMDAPRGEGSPGPVGLQLPEQPLNARAFFSRYDGLSTREVIEALAERFYVVPLREDQLFQLTRSLEAGAPGAGPFEAGRWPESSLRGVLHLMMSTAEFQLC